MFGIGPGEALLIVFALAFFFGAKRIPEIGASIGKAITAYKTARWGNTTPGESGGSTRQDDAKDIR